MNLRKNVAKMKAFILILSLGTLAACGGGGGGGGGTVTPPPAPANNAPMSSAGSDQFVIQGSNVSLSGTASDADGSVSSTQWLQTGGTSVTLGNDTTLTPSFDAPAVTQNTLLTFSLTVTDDDNATSVDLVTVTIVPDNNNRVILGPLIEANVTASRASNSAGSIETTVTNNANNLSEGGSFSLLLDGIPDNEWVLVTVTGGTDIDVDDDNVLDVVPTLNAGTIRALGRAADWRTSGMNVTMVSEIAVRRLLEGNVNLDTLDSQSIQIQLTGLAQELLGVDVNSDSSLDFRDILAFTPANSQNLRMDTFTPAELNALAQSLVNGDNQQVTTSVSTALTFPTFATIRTSLGDIKLRLFSDQVPNTANNFAVHARNGFYDGQVFHRVISGFIIQGGDPNGNGSGGASILGGRFDDEFDESLSNVEGTISMANSGPNTNGSQFFINVVDNTGLDFDKAPASSAHAVFGEIVSGADVMLSISNTPTDAQDRPVTPVVIDTIEISRQ